MIFYPPSLYVFLAFRILLLLSPSVSETVFLLNGVHPYLHTRSTTEKLSTIFAEINHVSMCIYVCVYMYIYIESWNSSKSFFIGRFLDKGSNRVKDWPGGRNMISSGFVVVPWNFITQYCRAWKDVLNVFRLLRYKIASWYHISVNDALNRFPASIGILFDSKFSFFFFYKKKEINVIAFDTKKKIRDTIYINWIKSNDIYV